MAQWNYLESTDCGIPGIWGGGGPNGTVYFWEPWDSLLRLEENNHITIRVRVTFSILATTFSRGSQAWSMVDVTRRIPLVVLHSAMNPAAAAAYWSVWLLYPDANVRWLIHITTGSVLGRAKRKLDIKSLFRIGLADDTSPADFHFTQASRRADNREAFSLQ